jgi:hypothetical protein
MRKRWEPVVAAGGVMCARCRKPIHPREKWHLGHDDSGTRWIGPEHAACNLADGGRKRAAQLYGRPAGEASTATPARWSRHWCGGFDDRCPVCRASGVPCTDAEVNTQGGC